MRLLDNEEKILSSNQNTIILTNNRILLNDQIWGKSRKVSIFLENISSIEVNYENNIPFLISGTGITLFGLYMLLGSSEQIGVFALIIGIILLAIWSNTRKHTVKISSNGGSSIKFTAEGMSDDTIDKFITNLQNAKLHRINDLYVNKNVQ